MKKKIVIEKKLKEIKQKLSHSPEELGQSFSYWLGFRRALEWMLENQERHQR